MLFPVGTLTWAGCLVAVAAGIGAAMAAMHFAGLLIGLSTGVIMALPAQVMRAEGRALGMGIVYTWLDAGHAALPPPAGRLQDLSGQQPASLYAAAALVLLVPLYGLFHWLRGATAGRTARAPRPRR